MIKTKDCRHGPMMYNDTDMYIGQSFHHYGEFSESEISTYKQVVKPNMTVIDVGANIGAITIPLAQQVAPHGTVHAFEPQRWIYYMLCGNVALNNLHNVHCYQCGVGEQPGKSRMPITTYEQFYNYGGIATNSELPHKTSEEVDVVRLDDFDIKPHFIKIDAEGAELAILKGAEEMIKASRPIMSVEALDGGQDIRKYLKGLDYQSRLLTYPAFETDNFFKNPNNVFVPPAVMSPNLFCVPNEIKFSVNK